MPDPSECPKKPGESHAYKKVGEDSKKIVLRCIYCQDTIEQDK